MLAPNGYTLGKCLYSSPRCEVYAGVRDDDEAPVALKFYRGSAEYERATHEHDLLRAIRGPGLPRPLELISAPSPTLVFELISGARLSAWAQQAPVSPAHFLDVAIQLTQSVSALHEARSLHRDLQPDNVLVDAETLATHLVGFGLAQPLGAAEHTEVRSGTNSFTGPPRYIAPEQTGRMGRGVDTRSDLYSLGATFYFVLTGEPPFDGPDHLALYHAHMARLPEPPVARRPDLPGTLSRIVFKLLQKEPEDRYQTARALQRDLSECRDQLRRTGRIEDDFPLGTADAPFRPLFSKKLHGRDAEVGALRAAYARAVQGRTQLVTLTGPPGSGKSSLVHELRRALPETSGYLTTGKFDLYRRDVPYVGFSAAFQSLFDQILTESEARVAQWRERLRTALGNLIGVVVEWIPELGLIVGETPPAPKLGPRETQARLALAVYRLVEGCAHLDHPLVLVLEDLQWSDPGSRDLLESLLRKSEGGALLVLMIYRSDEVDASHPLAALLDRSSQSSLQLTRISLDPLSIEACAEILGEALAKSPAEVRGLAECVVRKTGSNPLLIQQFASHMHQLGLIAYGHPTGWIWDEAAITAADIPEGAVALMVTKLEMLEARPRALLEFASCVADEFTVEWLAELWERPRETLEPSLFALTQEGLLAPSPRGFRFVHDRIREAAQALLSDAQRAALHHRIGRLLLDKNPQESLAERAFETADHLNRAGPVLSELDRPRAMAVNLAAGRRALAAGAAATASSYLQFGRALFRDYDWERNPELAFDLFWQGAEAGYQARDYPLALQLLQILEPRPAAPERSLLTTAAKIRSLVQVNLDAALEETLAALRQVGMRWPKNVSRLRAKLAILFTDWVLRKRIVDFPPASAEEGRLDARRASSMVLVTAGGSALTWKRPELFCVMISDYLRYAIRHGVLSNVGLSISTHAMSRMRFLQSLSLTKRYADAIERSAGGEPDPRLQFMVWAFLHSWCQPRRRVQDALWACAERLGESGEIEYRSYALQEYFGYLALSGEPLDGVARKLADLRRQVGMRDAPYLEHYLNAYKHLQQRDEEQIDWERELAPGPWQSRTGLMAVYHMHWTTVLCFLGDYERASAQARAAEPFVFSFGSPAAYVADFMMFHGLAHAALAAQTSGSRKRQALQSVRRCYRLLMRWSGDAPDTLHMGQLLEAERARLAGHTAAAVRAYQSAAQRAKERGFRHHAALAHERKAQALQHVRRWSEANLALGQAIELYKEWSAHTKVRQLEALQRQSAY